MTSDIQGGFGLYVHWPFCLSKCPYCDFNSHVREGIDARDWTNALCTDLEAIASRLPVRSRLDSIFFGGGTPSLMPPETAAAVIDKAVTLFPPAPDIEITLEANPTSSEAGRFQAFRKAGVNRLSLGVQSLDDDALGFLGRKHSMKAALSALDLARGIFARLSFDLIYARPGQTARAWQDELKRALALGADHLSLYQLAIEPGTKFATLAQEGLLHALTDDRSSELYDLTQDMTEAAGLPAYEISNHAHPGEESRHNLIYWRGGAWIGIGPGAHGRLPASDGGRLATESEKLPERWLALVREHGTGIVSETPISPREQAQELLLMGLRLGEGVDLQRLNALDSELLDQTKLRELVEAGLLTLNAAGLAATRAGRPVLNRLIVELIR